MTEEEEKKYHKSTKEVCERFHITEEEFYARNKASISHNKWHYPNYVINSKEFTEKELINDISLYDEQFMEVLYFDGDDGRAIIKAHCEIFDERGCQIRLHECSYCDFEYSEILEIMHILMEFNRSDE